MSKISKKIFKKGTRADSDSYSAFFNDAMKKESTGLNEFLKEHQVNTLFIVGLVLEYCLVATAIDGLTLGYEVFLIKEGVASLCSGDEQYFFFESLENRGVQVTSIKAFI